MRNLAGAGSLVCLGRARLVFSTFRSLWSPLPCGLEGSERKTDASKASSGGTAAYYGHEGLFEFVEHPVMRS